MAANVGLFYFNECIESVQNKQTNQIPTAELHFWKYILKFFCQPENSTEMTSYGT